MTDPNDSRRRDLISDVVNDLLEHPTLRRWLRETMLLLLVEQEEIRKRGAVRVFIDGCRQLGVHLTAWEDGRVGITRPELLSGELKAVLAIHKPAIWDYLVSMGHVRPSSETEARRKAL